jgi:ribosomal protein S14
MTAKDFSKVANQLEQKPAKWAKYNKHNAPLARAFGRSVKKCELCGTTRGVMGQWQLNVCRRCFRANAQKLGFKKLN